MTVELVRAGLSDAEAIWRMQTEAFSSLLDRYQDVDTNPACETIERVKQRMLQPESLYYLIVSGEETIGAIRVTAPKDGCEKKRISPLFIRPAHQGKGAAQAAIREAERIHGSEGWRLDTIAQEAGNCHLYEKMGYRPTGKTLRINERMTLIGYKK